MISATSSKISNCAIADYRYNNFVDKCDRMALIFKLQFAIIYLMIEVRFNNSRELITRFMNGLIGRCSEYE